MRAIDPDFAEASFDSAAFVWAGSAACAGACPLVGELAEEPVLDAPSSFVTIPCHPDRALDPDATSDCADSVSDGSGDFVSGAVGVSGWAGLAGPVFALAFAPATANVPTNPWLAASIVTAPPEENDPRGSSALFPIRLPITASVVRTTVFTPTDAPVADSSETATAPATVTA